MTSELKGLAHNIAVFAGVGGFDSRIESSTDTETITSIAASFTEAAIESAIKIVVCRRLLMSFACARCENAFACTRYACLSGKNAQIMMRSSLQEDENQTSALCAGLSNQTLGESRRKMSHKPNPKIYKKEYTTASKTIAETSPRELI